MATDFQRFGAYMNNNETLGKAKLAKQDEFYTQLSDIENEMRHYKKHFKGKTVFCNCDDPYESNFFRYFALNFNRLGLKKLIATCYDGSPIAGKQLQVIIDGDNLQIENDIEQESVNKPTAYIATVTTVYDSTGDGGIDMFDIAELFRIGENKIEKLNGNGDFRSQECLELLKESDIVVTNPPFSLFREYVATLVAHKKKFIIIGTMNAIKYKEIFPLIMNDELWLGYKTLSGGMDMIVPEKVFDPSKVKKFTINDKGERIVNVMGVCWFTNLDIRKRHETMILVRRYDPETYPKYVNYDAIEVSKANDIPCDYAGEMGVPITFLDKFNPEQFEIVGMSPTLGKPTQETIAYDVARGRKGGKGGAFYTCVDGQYRRIYDRLVIRNKHPEQPKEK